MTIAAALADLTAARADCAAEASPSTLAAIDAALVDVRALVAPAPSEVRLPYSGAVIPAGHFLPDAGVNHALDVTDDKLRDYSGCGWDLAREEMHFFGHGHSAGWGNDVVSFDVRAGRWRVTAPKSTPGQGVCEWIANPAGGMYDPWFNKAECEYGDGKPAGSHTYGTLVVVGRRLIRPATYAAHPNYSSNCGRASAWDLDSGAYERFSTNLKSNGAPGAAACHDPDRGRVWVYDSVGSGTKAFAAYLDLADRTHKRLTIPGSTDPAYGGAADSPQMQYMARQRAILLTTNSSNTAYAQPIAVRYLVPEQPSLGWQKAKLEGDLWTGYTAGQQAWTYCAWLDEWLVLWPKDPTAVFHVKVPDDLAAPWRVKRVALPAGQGGVDYISGNAWQAVPSLRLCVYVPVMKTRSAVPRFYNPTAQFQE